MKTLAFLAVTLAVSTASLAQAASVPQGHQLGGPVKQGSYCWVATNANGAGWWDRCDGDTQTPQSHHGLPYESFSAQNSGGGGGGGGR